MGGGTGTGKIRGIDETEIGYNNVLRSVERNLEGVRDVAIKNKDYDGARTLIGFAYTMVENYKSLLDSREDKDLYEEYSKKAKDLSKRISGVEMLVDDEEMLDKIENEFENPNVELAKRLSASREINKLIHRK